MPNILIVGFPEIEAEGIRDRVENLLRQHGEGHDAITTILDAKTRECSSGKPAPFLSVLNTKQERSEKIAKLLNEGLNLDVELSSLIRFYPRKTGN